MLLRTVSCFTVILSIMRLRLTMLIPVILRYPDVVLASTAFLNSLSDEDREIFDRLIKELYQEEFETFKQDIEVAKKDAEKRAPSSATRIPVNCVSVACRC